MSHVLRSDRVVNRRRFLTVSGSGMAAVAGALILPSTAKAIWPVLREGDVFVTRNPWNNIVPGYWNHTALYSAGRVYEAQINPGTIRSVTLGTFRDSYPRINILRLHAQYLVPRMVQYAKSLVGKPYTILPYRGGYSCVLYVRASYYYATLAYRAVDPGWFIPDHIASDNRFVFVGSK